MFTLDSNNRRSGVIITTLAVSISCLAFHFIFNRTGRVDTVQPRDLYGNLPLLFEPNHGQAESRFDFLSRGRGYDLFLSPTEALLEVRNARRDTAGSLSVRMKLAGADARAEASGTDPLPGKINYFIGNDPGYWLTNVPAYAGVKYREVYPSIDLVYYGNSRRLEYDFILRPGADPGDISMVFEGTDRVEIDNDGNLVLGRVIQHKPLIYQETNGARREVTGGYVQTGRHRIGFEVGAYDPSKPLIIDPVLTLSYATYLGGGDQDLTTGIAVDAEGSIYVTGLTESLGFPTRDPLQPAYGGGELDAFVAKLNPTGTALVYATFLGGHDLDRGFGIALDDSGSVYVIGQTASNNFPTKDPVQSAFNGVTDIFVTKLNPAGSAIVYSTYLGGSGNDPGLAIAVDPAGNAYVTGWTNSANFPVKQPLQPALADAGGDVIAAKFDQTGSLIFSTYLGGNNFDRGLSIAADASGNAYLTGETRSGNFPTSNALQPMKGSPPAVDAFVAKLNPDGSEFIYSTYLGGSGGDEGRGIAVDTSGNVYLTGWTSSVDFPTKNPLQTVLNGEARDAFVAKLNAEGSALVYSTYLGGSGTENDENGSFGGAIAVDAAGNAYVMGSTGSPDFPVKSPLPQTLGGIGYAFLARLNQTGSALVYSTRLGSGQDAPFFGGLAIDLFGNAYVSLSSSAGGFPTTPGAFQQAFGGRLDGLIIKVAAITSSGVSCASAASFSWSALAPESIAAAFGTDLATTSEAASMTPLPIELGGTSVRVRDRAGAEHPAHLYFVSPTQINFLMPAGLVEGTATVTVTSTDGFVSTGSIYISGTAPGLFSADASGGGAAAAVALRIRADGSSSYEPAAGFDAVQNKFVSIPIDLGPETDQVFLALFGTGIRGRSSLSATMASIGGQDAQVVYAGPQGDLVGLDQVNLRIPRSLKGRGEVDVLLIVDNRHANKVRANIK